MNSPTVIRMKGILNFNGARESEIEDVVYIGRNLNMGGWRLKKSKWHNPYKVGVDGDIDEVLIKYENYLKTKIYDKNDSKMYGVIEGEFLMDDLEELNGKILGCWCKKKGYEKCHGDILVKVFNEKFIK